MRWSKLRSLIEANICSSLSPKISIHSARYGNCTCGRAWITLDGVEVANLCTRAYFNKKLSGKTQCHKSKNKYEVMFVEYGKMSRQNVYEACWTFIHEITIEKALISEDPFIQFLAVIDKRVGKRRLESIDPRKFCNLAKRFFELRIEAEGIENQFLTQIDAEENRKNEN